MMEFDPHYADVIIQRYIKLMGTNKDVYRINPDGSKTTWEEIREEE